MHSMHQLQAHSEPSGHVQQSQQSIGGPNQENHAGASIGQEQQTTNMTVLVQLDAAQPTNVVAEQPILSGLEPVQQQPLGNRAMQSAGNQQAQIIHHMAQQQHQSQPQSQPQLHVLRAPSMAKQDPQSEHLEHLVEQRLQGGHSSRATASRQQQQQQQQQQLEGSTAETQEMVNRWLLDNYEIADGESLPRSTVYNHYISYCRHLRTTPQNAASFGKQIRSVFVGLKTRRLGTRGHSKYHYFGIRAKNHVNLEWLQASEHMDSSHEAQRRRAVGCSSMMNDPSQENSNTDQGSESDSTADNHSGRLSSLGGSISNNATCNGSKRPRRHQPPELAAYGQPMDHQASRRDEMIDSNQHHNPDGGYYSNGFFGKQDRVWPLEQIDVSSLQQHLGSNSEALVAESWPHREQGLIESQLNERLRNQAPCDESGNSLDLASLVQVFESQYKAYYRRMVDMLSKCQFNEAGSLWSEFWRPPPTEAQKHEPANQWQSSETAGANGNQYHQSLEGGQHLGSHQASQQQHIQHEQHHLVYPHHDHQIMVNPLEVGLSFNQLYQLTSLPPMIERINEIDCKLYTAIETFLMPDLLSPVPRAFIHQIRVFARDFGVWMESLIKDYPSAFAVEKLKSSRAFEHALNRYTSINHLASSSRAIWSRRSVLAQMSMDLNRIDLRDIEHQVALMSQAKCDGLLDNHEQHQRCELPVNGELGRRHQQAIAEHNGASNAHNHTGRNNNHTNSNNINNMHQTVHDNSENSYLNNDDAQIYSDQTDQSPVHRVQAAMQPAQLIQHFLHLLDDPYPANVWPDWCRDLVESRVRGHSLEEARNFILKWNFYVSLIMRELTLRSAPSLGSFQLIRLLFDEYMYYLVVMRLAQAQHKTSIQLMTGSMKFDTMH